MTLYPQDFAFDCNCGHKHNVTLEKTVIKPGALFEINEHMASCGIKGKIAAVYDNNTYDAVNGRKPKADNEIILNAENLHANENAIEQLEAKLTNEDIIIAVGSGTIHDVSRYVAAKHNAVLVGAPTAASVDGFSSNTSAMTLNGFKTSVKAVPPKLIVADSSVIAKAPLRLNASGVGDVIGKYIALADWEIAHVLTGEDYCSGTANLMRKAVEAVVEVYAQIKNGGENAASKLVHALIFSGVAMQIWINSRPAAGAEHYISHMMELPLPWFGKTNALHGEKVGVGTVVFSKIYNNIAKYSKNDIKDILAKYPNVDFTKLPAKASIENIYGELTDSIIKENENICSKDVTAQGIIENWEKVQQILANVPSEEKMKNILSYLNAPVSLEDIGQEKSIQEKIINWSPLARNRLTVNRIRTHIINS